MIGRTVGHYRILERLGGGGMGVVYKAEDTKLGRMVALKFLPPELTRDPDAKSRFLREARAASLLDHSNICTIHEIGETDDEQTFIAMACYDGETLKARIERGVLEVEEALKIAEQIARGLGVAHEAGIVHRDIKPANVMLTAKGVAKILDFGLAKLTGATHITQSKTTLGTLAYMAPEQLRGEEVGPQADLWSLGVVLFELLTGRLPFRGDFEQAIGYAIANEEPLSLADVRPDAPEEIDRIVTKLLCKDPRRRYQTAEELLTELEPLRASSSGSKKTGPGSAKPGEPNQAARSSGGDGRRGGRASWRRIVPIAVGCMFAIALAGGYFLRGRSRAPASADTGPRRIVVLPFENLGAPEDGYFADGMTDEVRGKLAGLPGLEVIARGSAVQYKGSSKTPQEIARELDTPFLLTATVRWQKSRGGSQIRFAPELVEVGSGGRATTRWQGTFDAELEDVFRVQSEIATLVARALEVALSDADQRRIALRPTSDLAAYDAFLRAEELFWSSVPRARDLSIERYERAVALDPGFAIAWARLSTARAIHFHVDIPSRSLRESIRSAAERALQLAPDLPEARAAMGMYFLMVPKDPARAREELMFGLARSPGHAELLAVLGAAEHQAGLGEEAGRHLEQALSLDPRSVFPAIHFCRNLRTQRLYPQALEAYDRALAIHPDNLVLLNEKAQLYLSLGDLAGARKVFAEAASRVDPKLAVAYMATRFDLYWALDDTQQKLLLETPPAAFDDNRALRAFVLAETYALRGDANRAREIAGEAREEYARQLAECPDDAERLILLGEVLAYMGRYDEAIRETRRGVELVPLSRNAFFGAFYQHQFVRVYLLAGENEKALDLLEPLLTSPYTLTPAWLAIDPTFAPLKGNPRFEKLLGSNEVARE